MSDEVVQVWVRNEKGQVFGPLSPSSVELLLDNGVIVGRVQVSLDGINYVFPGRMPGIRMVFPKTLWGDQVLPPNELDDVWSKVVAPPPLPTAAPQAGGAGAVPGGPVPGGPVAGPGAAPRAGPMAGPGARAAQTQVRPPPSAQQRPPQPRTAPTGVPMVQRPGAPAAPASLGDSLFGDMPQSSPSQVMSTPSGIRAAPPAAPRPAANSMASIAAAMGQAPMPPAPAPVAPPFASSPSTATAAPPPPQSRPSSVAAAAALEQLPQGGTLTDFTARRLYFLAAAQDTTGLLTLQLPDRAVMLHFRKGSPDSVESTHPDDALATFLLRQRLVGPEQLGQAQKEGARFGGELLPALFGLGLLNPNAAIEALNQRVAGLIGLALRSTEGSFTFQAIDLPAQKAMPPGNRWQLYVEQLRKLSVAELREQLISALDFPIMKASGAVAIGDMRLSPQETRVYSQFDGTRTLNTFLQANAPETEHALRVAFMLEPCDLVSFAGTVVKTSAPARNAPRTPAAGAPVAPPKPVVMAPVAAPPPVAVQPSVVPGPPVAPRVPSYPGAPPPPGAQPARPPPVMPQAAPAPVAPARPVITAAGPVIAPPAAAPPANAAPPRIAAPVVAPTVAPAAVQNFTADIKRLTDLLATMKKQNHFEVLAVTKDSPASAVKVAYFKLAKDHHPDTVPAGAPEALHKLKVDIFARIGEAHRTLSDENLKKEYVAELESGGAGEKIDVSKLLQAEEYFQKGKILIQARKYPEAFKMFDDAIALTPEGDPEAYTWRGYARFFTFPDKKAGLVEAMKDVTNCLKRNPNVVAAHFHQGMMHKILGDMAAAKKHFQATVKLDPKHIDAQRELRMMK
ncbi:MAG: DnaJ domain-containing protein [Archangiaceae bacterium]|nr:DnaJ domain-containing protein [Archangiaceae bacterium]